MTDPLFLHPHPVTTQAELNLLRRPEPITPEDRASLLRVLREPLTQEAATVVLTMSAAIYRPRWWRCGVSWHGGNGPGAA